MLLSKKKSNNQKQHNRNDSTKSLTFSKKLNFGSWGLFSLQSGKISNRQLQAILLFLRRAFGKQAKIFSHVHLYRSITKKPNETRLGRGKGNVKYWSFIVRPGTLILELRPNSTNINKSKQILQKIKYNISVKTRIIYKYYRWTL